MCTDFYTGTLKEIYKFSVFLEYTFRFLNFCKYFCTFEFDMSTRFRNKYLDFCKIAIFLADYWNRAQGLSKNVSNVIDLDHNKKIEGGGNWPPPPVSQSVIGLRRCINFVLKLVHSFNFLIKGSVKFKLRILIFKGPNKLSNLLILKYSNPFIFANWW